MRKVVLALTIAGVALGVMPARAYVRTVKSKSLTFSAVPCSVLCGYGDLEEGDDYACSDPMVPGSYGDHAMRVPSTANYMIFTATPSIDWDIFVCRSGKVAAYSAIYYINEFGVQETIGMRVKPGTSYILRAYNQKDTEDLAARVTFKYVKF